MQRIIIRHQRGSKANQVEDFPLEGLRELSLGRNSSCHVRFDPERDDLVSRHHASIRIHNDGELSFKISDEKSRNGTIVGGRRVTGEAELLPGDVVELGPGGPRFVFDVEPRPLHLAARTRTMSPEAGVSTRAFDAADTGYTGETIEPKSAIGRGTVERLINEAGGVKRRTWIASLAVVFAVLTVLGVALFYQNTALKKETKAEIDQAADNLVKMVGPHTTQQIVAKYRDAVVHIDLTWRLYHRESGKQVFHKFVGNGKDPAYVKLNDGTIVRWLVTDDDNHTNAAVQRSGHGSGFVIYHNGFILTNKHVAAGWLSPFELADYERNCNGCGRLYQEGSRYNGRWERFTPQDHESLFWWIPGGQENSYLFKQERAELTATSLAPTQGLFEGRNDVLDVRFPGQNVSVQARLVRADDEVDLALVKVEVPYDLRTFTQLLEADEEPTAGEKVTIMGYPEYSERAYRVSFTIEAGSPRQNTVLVPEPTVTESIISSVGKTMKDVEGRPSHRDIDLRGDVYQLTANVASEGNSGGPVFNSAGQVIGITTYVLTSTNGERIPYAVPAKYGHKLIKFQDK